MSDPAGGRVMSRIKNSPFLTVLLSVFFTLILGSYAYTHSESGKKMEKDTFNLFLTEYRTNTSRMFDMIKGLKE